MTTPPVLLATHPLTMEEAEGLYRQRIDELRRSADDAGRDPEGQGYAPIVGASAGSAVVAAR